MLPSDRRWHFLGDDVRGAHLSGLVQPALGFYGDDFTGSTDAMEALAVGGVDTLLFLRTPDVAEIDAARSRYAAVGIAGISRSKDPSWMIDKLPEPYLALKRLGAPLIHYKVCSTFDSSPSVGNIGTARAGDWAKTRRPTSIAVPILPTLGDESNVEQTL